jgi:hypothetical protein
MLDAQRAPNEILLPCGTSWLEKFSEVIELTHVT